MSRRDYDSSHSSDKPANWDARNTERRVEVADDSECFVRQYAVEENQFAPLCPVTEKEICGTGAVCAGGIDLSVAMLNYRVCNSW